MAQWVRPSRTSSSLCLPSCRLSSEHTKRLRGDSRTEKGRLERTGPRPPRPRSEIGARSGGCLSQKTSALHPGHEQREERGAAVANEVRGMILQVKYLVYFTTHKTAPLGATKSMKGYSCQCITHVGCCIKRKPRENIKVCVNVLPTSYRQVTDTLPTVGRLSADCRSTVGRQVAYISGKTCRPTVGRQTTNCWPTGFSGSSSSQLPKTFSLGYSLTTIIDG